MLKVIGWRLAKVALALLLLALLALVVLAVVLLWWVDWTDIDEGRGVAIAGALGGLPRRLT